MDTTISVLRGLKFKYAAHHGVRIADGAVVAAARLSDRYITSRFLPDKAIDLMDEACAGVRVELDSEPAVLDSVKRRRLQYGWVRGPGLHNDFRVLRISMCPIDIATLFVWFNAIAMMCAAVGSSLSMAELRISHSVPPTMALYQSRSAFFNLFMLYLSVSSKMGLALQLQPSRLLGIFSHAQPGIPFDMFRSVKFLLVWLRPANKVL